MKHRVASPCFMSYVPCFIIVSEESKNNIHEREIRELEQLLEEKKKELIERGEEKERKEIFKEVFQEKYRKIAGAPVPPPVAPGTAPVTPAKTPVVPEEKETELQTLIQAAFSDGLVAAVSRAKAANPWLLDELHDRLSDEYYEKLVQAGEITGN